MNLQPSDIVVIRTNGLVAWGIRLGEMLQGKPDLANHVAMFHHASGGTNWYLEGRPGGLGWASFSAASDPYGGSKWSASNAAQPRTAAQRDAACEAMRQLLGTPYDWDAIIGDAEEALRIPAHWEPWSGKMPGHVICSSAATWSYQQAGILAPEVDGGRLTEPADWEDFIMTAAWESAASRM